MYLEYSVKFYQVYKILGKPCERLNISCAWALFFFLKGPDASQKTAKFVHCASCFVNCQLHCLVGAVGLSNINLYIYLPTSRKIPVGLSNINSYIPT